MEGLQAAAEFLAQRSQSPPQPVETDFCPIPVAPRPLPQAAAACVAVDGSSAVLVDNGATWVVAYRAAAVRWPGPPVAEPQPRVVATVPGEAQALADAAYARAGLEGPAIRSADALAEALRGLAELDAVLAAVAGMARGDLLLIDGALVGLPPGPAVMAARIAEAAEAKGVRVSGVAKRSGIEGRGNLGANPAASPGNAGGPGAPGGPPGGAMPLVPALMAEATRRGIVGPWSVEAEPGVHVAKLHRAAKHAFRIDADAAVLPDLVALSNDAAYTGYPYPLAVAHNRVALTGAHVRDLKARLDLELRRRGSAAAGLARDFHAVLDANVPG